MAYTPNPTDDSQPTGSVPASTAAAEFRAIKAYLNGVVAAGLPAQPPGGGVLTSDGSTVRWGRADGQFSFINYT